MVWAGVTHGNDRSAAVLDRLGFGRVAVLERHARDRVTLLRCEGENVGGG